MLCSISCLPLTPEQKFSLKQTQPFLYELLTTTALTTPLLEKKIGQPLKSQQWFRQQEKNFIRRNQLQLSKSPNTIIEIAEVTFSDPIPEWAKITEPLGPWLTSQGYVLEKKSITPLLFPSCDFLQNIFATTESCYGRSYEFQVTIPNDLLYSLSTVEIWNPQIICR
jgi:hypothetical protein